ncbi:hypothetical protein KY311_03145, partial [Candidatus Woesearchaeota archaeon]|nr:hypothetical protein [Candidatus Woesearchaeota archaeon]
MKALFNATNIVYFMSVALAFVFPSYASDLNFMLIPILLVLMTLSLKGMKLDGDRKNIKKSIKTAIALVAMNYVLLPVLIIASAFLFVKNTDYFNGMILFAAIPPATGIIPLVYLTKGNVKLGFFAQIIAYCSAVIYTPLLIYFLSGAGVNMWFLFRTIFLLIVLPFILSRFIVNLEWKVFKYNKYAANVLFALLFYIIIGTNYSRIVGDFVSLIPL